MCPVEFASELFGNAKLRIIARRFLPVLHATIRLKETECAPMFSVMICGGLETNTRRIERT